MNDHIPLEDLSAHIDDELRPDRAAEVDAHLATCAVCRSEIDSLRWSASFARSLPRARMPAGTSLRLPVDAPAPARHRWLDLGLDRLLAFGTAGALAVLALVVLTGPSRLAPSLGRGADTLRLEDRRALAPASAPAADLADAAEEVAEQEAEAPVEEEPATLEEGATGAVDAAARSFAPTGDPPALEAPAGSTRRDRFETEPGAIAADRAPTGPAVGGDEPTPAAADEPALKAAAISTHDVPVVPDAATPSGERYAAEQSAPTGTDQPTPSAARVAVATLLAIAAAWIGLYAGRRRRS